MSAAFPTPRTPREVRRLIESGADLNSRTKTGLTPLMVAAQHGHISVLSALLTEKKLKLNLEAITPDKKTALTLAVLADHQEAADILIRHGANTEHAHRLNYTPLMLAIKNNYTSLALQLMRRGARINTANYYDETPLALAARHCRDPDVINTIIRRKAHLDTQDIDGLTPLMTAALHNNLVAVEILLQAGAKKAVKDMRGHTALMIARQQRHHEALALLGGPTRQKTVTGDNSRPQPAAPPIF